MKIAAISLAFAIWISPSTGNAQLTVDMSSVTCGQYLAMPRDHARDFSAWMSGWFNHKKGFVWVDLVAYEQNIAKVKALCTARPNDTVMSVLERATTTN
jgi:acid stress chaperone HdeB